MDADGCVSVPTVKWLRYGEALIKGETMMDDTRFTPRPLQKWFWIGAVAVLLFMLAGVAGYFVTVTTPIDQLPADQQAKMAAMPGWQTAVYAIAIWTGLLGAIALIVRRRWAVPLLLLSLIGAIGTFLPFAIVPQVRELGTAGDWVAAVIVIGLCWVSFWFARSSQQRGWLR